MTSLASLLKQTNKLVIPPPAERVKISRLARELLRKTRRAAERFPEVRGVLMGGSFAKGTWLPKHVDLDVFVRIDPATPVEQFEKVGL